MIAEVIIDVRYADEEHDASPQLFQVACWVGSLLAHCFCELKVACALAIPTFQHGHCRGEVNSVLGVGAVKSPAEERVVFAPKLAAQSVGDHDPGFSGQRM